MPPQKTVVDLTVEFVQEGRKTLGNLPGNISDHVAPTDYLEGTFVLATAKDGKKYPGQIAPHPSTRDKNFVYVRWEQKSPYWDEVEPIYFTCVQACMHQIKDLINYDTVKNFYENVMQFAKDGKMDPPELLIHWTPKENINSILQNGFLVPGKPTNGATYGIGVYAATNFKSHQHYGKGTRKAKKPHTI